MARVGVSVGELSETDEHYATVRAMTNSVIRSRKLHFGVLSLAYHEVLYAHAGNTAALWKRTPNARVVVVGPKVLFARAGTNIRTALDTMYWYCTRLHMCAGFRRPTCFKKD